MENLKAGSVIDEKWLNEMEASIRGVRVTPKNQSDANDLDMASILEPAIHTVYLELIRLARLGLWAEKHGIPALQQAFEISENNFDSPHFSRLDSALAALPKEMK